MKKAMTVSAIAIGIACLLGTRADCLAADESQQSAVKQAGVQEDCCCCRTRATKSSVCHCCVSEIGPLPGNRYRYLAERYPEACAGAGVMDCDFFEHVVYVDYPNLSPFPEVCELGHCQGGRKAAVREQEVDANSRANGMSPFDLDEPMEPDADPQLSPGNCLLHRDRLGFFFGGQERWADVFLVKSTYEKDKVQITTITGFGHEIKQKDDIDPPTYQVTERNFICGAPERGGVVVKVGHVEYLVSIVKPGPRIPPKPDDQDEASPQN